MFGSPYNPQANPTHPPSRVRRHPAQRSLPQLHIPTPSSSNQWLATDAPTLRFDALNRVTENTYQHNKVDATTSPELRRMREAVQLFNNFTLFLRLDVFVNIIDKVEGINRFADGGAKLFSNTLQRECVQVFADLRHDVNTGLSYSFSDENVALTRELVKNVMRETKYAYALFQHIVERYLGHIKLLMQYNHSGGQTMSMSGYRTFAGMPKMPAERQETRDQLTIDRARAGKGIHRW
ncbi:hypothetical protein JCM11641_003023 [Rhodosporidiobolus odoratus]